MLKKSLGYLFSSVLSFSCLLYSPAFANSEMPTEEKPTEEIKTAEVKVDEVLKSFYDLSLEELLDVSVKKKEIVTFYGFANVNFEKVFNKPGWGYDGKAIFEKTPIDLSIPNFLLYATSDFSQDITFLVGLSKDDEHIGIDSLWGNVKINDAIQIKLGKMYRKFGLFNEKLQDLPTFTGIEAPELFDGDHLMLPRTTELMIHGKKHLSESIALMYAVDTGVGEGNTGLDALPLGWDLRMKVDTNFEPLLNPSIIFGTSGYISSLTNTKTKPNSIGEHAIIKTTGISQWMESDNYGVFGGFIEANLFENLLLQTAYWYGNHNAIRNPESVLNIIKNTNLSQNQKQRFLGNNTSKPIETLTTKDIVLDAKYNIQTYYIRLGYSFNTPIGGITPYLFLDWMSNPELIENKNFGGDDEVGISDNGQFLKPSIGVVYRPLNELAIKLDGSTHIQTFNGKTESYPEVRFDVSFAFK